MSNASSSHRIGTVRLAIASAGIASAGFAAATATLAPVSFWSDIARDLLGGRTETALAVGITPAIALAVLPAAAALERRIGMRWTAGLGLLLLGLATMLSVVAWDISDLSVARAMLGLALGSIGALALDRRNAGLARVGQYGLAAGAIAGLPIATVIGMAGGWRGVFGLVAILAVILLPMLAALPGRRATTRIGKRPEVSGGKLAAR